MTGLPADAIRYRVAADVPCRTCHGHGKLIHPIEHRPIHCNHCNGRGTRTVVTDVEVESDDAVSGDIAIRVWLEVEP